MDMKYSTGMALEIIWKDNSNKKKLINDHQLFYELELFKLTE